MNPRVRADGTFIQHPANAPLPVIIDGRAFVSLNTMEAIGFDVTRQPASANQVTLSRQGVEIVVTIGSDTMLVNGDAVSLDTPAQIINGYMMIPVRTVAEAADLEVYWDGSNNIVHIFEPFSVDYWPQHLPRHIPGSVTLMPDPENWLLSYFPARLRFAYFATPLSIIRLVENRDAVTEWFEYRDNKQEAGELVEGMPLMHFVQHFNIPREDFDAAVEELRRIRTAAGLDLSDELHELPNADIIFSFDNNIIRYFYRRE